MKTYVITVSRQFPGKHPRKGQETNFVQKILNKEKIHTIRSNYDLWKKRFEKISSGKACLSIRYWEGKPYKSKQVEVIRLDKSHGIGIQKIEFPDYLYGAIVDERMFGIITSQLAANDGLSHGDFEDWFSKYKYDLSKPMALIHLTEFRYCNKKV